MIDLEKKVAVITGASSGIGAASARLLAKAGCHVVLVARRFDRLEQLSADITFHGGTAYPVQADIRKVDEIHRLVDDILTHFGHIDILLNNAGFGRLMWLEDLDIEEDIRAMVEVNLLGTIYLTRLFLPGMIARKQGHIINLVSIAGMVGVPTYTIYAATKYGMRGFTEALRREVGFVGIHVSGIYPGAVDTEFMDHVGANRKTRSGTPKWLMLSAEQIAQVVVKVAKRPRRMVLVPWPMVFAVWINTILPGLVDWAVNYMFSRSEKQPGD